MASPLYMVCGIKNSCCLNGTFIIWLCDSAPGLHGLQVPVAHEGRLLVDTAYLQKSLVDFGNEKMEANWARTDRLHLLFKDQLLSQQVQT